MPPASAGRGRRWSRTSGGSSTPRTRPTPRRAPTDRSTSSTSAIRARTRPPSSTPRVEAGHAVTPPNLPEGQGFSQTMVSQRRGARASTADAYLRPARRRRTNLRVVTGALVRASRDLRPSLPRVRSSRESALDPARVPPSRDRRLRRDRRHHPPGARTPRGHPGRRRGQHPAAAHAVGHRPGRAPRRARHPARRRQPRRRREPAGPPRRGTRAGRARAARSSAPRRSASSPATSRHDAGC